MARLYITKWVLARGILVTEAKVEHPPTPRGYIHRAWVALPGQRFKLPLFLGREAFLSLEEAQEDARKRFKAALKQAKTQLAYFKAANKRLNELTVHTKIESIGKCHAFTDIGVHSAGGWIVDPQRLGRQP